MPHNSLLDPRIADAFQKWFANGEFHLFVTLAFNEVKTEPVSRRSFLAMRRRLIVPLRKFDARVNHRILGRNWAKLHDERMFCAYVPEKVAVNPHWHGLVRFHPCLEDTVERHAEVFKTEAERIWKSLVPAGSLSVAPVTDPHRRARYVLKSVRNMIHYDLMILPDQFRRL